MNLPRNIILALSRAVFHPGPHLLCLLILVVAGCRSTGPEFDIRAPAEPLADFAEGPPPQGIDPEWLRAPTNLFTLGPGDQIEIELFDEEPYRRATTVGPDGKIYFYFLPGLDVWGLTLSETEQLLRSELMNYYENEPPQIGITLRGVESRRVWLLGRLRHPGVYPMAAPTTVLEGLSMAGGIVSASDTGVVEELADLRHAFVIRQGDILPVDLHELVLKGNMSHNIYLQPDDFIYVPSALSDDIFVLGAVRFPRSISSTGMPTLTTAIASAGGVIPNAYKSQIAIVRGSLSEPQIATVNLNEILKGQAPDVLLDPSDIVYVPLSPYRHLYRYLDVVVSTFIRAVAINEGSRMIAGESAPVGISIIIGAPGSTPVISPIR